MSKYVNIYKKTYEQYEVRCLLKLLTNKNDIKYIRISPNSNLHYSYYIPVKLISERINETCDNFSHISEMNITFISDLKDSTYEHYLSITKSMIEWKLNILLAKNPKLVRIIENSTHALIKKYNRIN